MTGLTQKYLPHHCPHGDKPPCYHYEAACGGSACKAGFVRVAATFTSRRGQARDDAEAINKFSRKVS